MAKKAIYLRGMHFWVEHIFDPDYCNILEKAQQPLIDLMREDSKAAAVAKGTEIAKLAAWQEAQKKAEMATKALKNANIDESVDDYIDACNNCETAFDDVHAAKAEYENSVENATKAQSRSEKRIQSVLSFGEKYRVAMMIATFLQHLKEDNPDISDEDAIAKLELYIDGC